MSGKGVIVGPSGKATLPKKEVSKFKLHGIELNGSLTFFFTRGEWQLTDVKLQPTRINGSDVQKLVDASKAESAVSLEYGNGNGKAKINSLHYDPKTETLTSIKIELVEWKLG